MTHTDLEHPSPPRRSAQVAVVVATKNRPDALANRAIRSIVAQTHPPDFLIVADDSDRRFREDNRRIVTSAPLARTRVVYLQNDRTAGASGAWNVALDWLHRQAHDAAQVYVAVLDDDDAWANEYLETCLREANSRDLDMVAADILRHQHVGDAGVLNPAPTELNAAEFLVCNPNIQGSNLFVRLSVLLAAGLFDEALTSTTDRDLCIRIADLGGIKYGSVPRALVHHNAEPTRARLSTPGSPAKLSGLTAFWRKYRGRMNALDASAFRARASSLFGWGEPAEPTPQPVADRAYPTFGGESIAIIVGATVSSARAKDARGLLDDLCALREDARLVNLEVVMLENGPRGHGGAETIMDLAAWLRGRGVGCFIAPIEQQASDADAGLFGAPFERGVERASIAVARTMLQTYCYQLARRRTGAVVWILDEDLRLTNPVWHAGIGIVRERLSIVEPLLRLRQAGVAVAIGTVTGAPPVPAASCVRTQLVDAYHNLEWFAALAPDAPVPDRMAENMAERSRCEDYYYDLSRRDTDHLESPFWFVPAEAACSARAALREMVERLPRILVGEEIFRPLVIDGAVDPIDCMKPSVHRGGNTFVFDIESLREFPNAVPEVAGHRVRRSDMVWSLLNRYVARRVVVKVPIAVYQDRGGEPVGPLDLDKLCRDIQGYAVYSALEDLFLAKLEERRELGHAGLPELGALADEDVAFVTSRFRKYLRERAAAFSLSFHRAAGLARAMRRYVEPTAAGSYWWLRDDASTDVVGALTKFVHLLSQQYDLSQLAPLQLRIGEVSDAVVRHYLAELVQDMAARRERPDAQLADTSWIRDQRLQNASAWLSRELGVTATRALGVGSEAVVLTDGAVVYKCIDYWKTRVPEAQMAFLRSQVGQWQGFRSLYSLTSVLEQGGRVLLTYPFEPSQPYQGGHGEGMVQLLRDCRTAGIVCTNINPDNLVVADGAVRLIDYGADIHPFTAEGFEQMARRAYLTWKFSARTDLKALLRRSIVEEAMPELEGLARFRSAVAAASKEALLDGLLSQVVGARPGGLLLDYGCGKGKLAVSLARDGWDVVAYDPDPSLPQRWHGFGGSGVCFVGSPGADPLRSGRGRFDAVVCSLVLCTLHDPAFEEVLADLVSAARPGGVVVIAVCNPRFVAAQTVLQHRDLPAGIDVDHAFEFTKTVHSTGARRVEVHRPEALYRKLLAKAGLEVGQTEETPGVDLTSFEYASDFLVFRCRRACEPNRHPAGSAQ